MNLSWTPPLNAHHSPVTHYVIHVREGEGRRWAPDLNGGVATPGSANSFRVVDLRPFTTYSFKVAAVNAAGRSRPSEESYYAMTLRARKYCTILKLLYQPDNRHQVFLLLSIVVVQL